MGESKRNLFLLGMKKKKKEKKWISEYAQWYFHEIKY